jgi:HAD superfamily hydrolase (TIGR01662 family)
MIRLIVFDLDGTLVESHTVNLLPHVQEFFQRIYQQKCSEDIRLKFAIATNQGGVGMRYWIQQGHPGDPEQYPREVEITQRLERLASELGWGTDTAFYVCYRYKDKTGKGTPVPPDRIDDPRWSMAWRKPGPGMLIQAMKDAGVSPQETLFVGNSNADRGAAAAAACGFAWASDFFGRDWANCKTLEEITK